MTECLCNSNCDRWMWIIFQATPINRSRKLPEMELFLTEWVQEDIHRNSWPLHNMLISETNGRFLALNIELILWCEPWLNTVRHGRQCYLLNMLSFLLNNMNEIELRFQLWHKIDGIFYSIYTVSEDIMQGRFFSNKLKRMGTISWNFEWTYITHPYITPVNNKIKLVTVFEEMGETLI